MFVESSVCDKDDLEQAGVIGMIHGLNSYNPDKAKKTKTKKTTYVIQCIRNQILQEANKFLGGVSVPYNRRLKLNKLRKLLSENNSKADVIRIMKITEKEFNTLIQIANTFKIWYDSTIHTAMMPAHDDFEERINEEYERAELNTVIESSCLNEQERQIVKLKLDGLTFQQMAEHFSLCRETIRKKWHAILDKLKKNV